MAMMNIYQNFQLTMEDPASLLFRAIVISTMAIFAFYKKSGWSIGLLRAYREGDFVHKLWYMQGKRQSMCKLQISLNGKQHAYMLGDATLIKQLQHMGEKVERRSSTPSDMVTSNMLLGSGGGSDHRRMRSAMHGYFRNEIFLSLESQLEKTVVARIKSATKTSHGIDLEEFVVSLTVELRLIVLFGVFSDDMSSAFNEKTKELGNKIMTYLSNPVGYNQLDTSSPQYQSLEREVQSIIESIEEPRDGTTLHYLHQQQQEGNLSAEEVIENLILFLVALAPAAVVVWTISHIVHHNYGKDVQHSELFLRQCLLETMRMTPGVPTMVMRKIISDDVSLDGNPIKRGSFICPWQTLMNKAENWNNPNKFDPLRWEHVVTSHPKDIHAQILSCPAAKLGSYFPFGFGKHRCLGMELALHEMTIILKHVFGQGQTVTIKDNVASNVDKYKWRKHVYGFPSKSNVAFFHCTKYM